MLLRSVHIEHFRAVRSTTICFDPTTVLIGENDCGRSSLMEAIALALGWNSGEGDFRFQAFHFHRLAKAPASEARPIVIELEFCENSPDEWRSHYFQLLRDELPATVGAERRFFLRVTHAPDDVTHWTFRSGRDKRTDHHALLKWLRRHMPVFWMAEGMIARKSLDQGSRTAQDPANTAGEVSQHYRELLEGTALDVTAAIEHGSAAARDLLLARAHLQSGGTTPLVELLEEVTGNRKVRFSPTPALLPDQGSASQRLGVLLLTGALLRSGAERVEQGMSPLTLLENPEAHLHPMTLASIWSIIERIGGQKVIATHSGTLLACARVSSVRRLTRRDGVVVERRVPEGALNADELRRYSYHLRSRRAEASFARCWLLVEGETEYWVMPELARVCGYDLSIEGVTCVEFAQCGLNAVIKVAKHFGIEWHLLADGDEAGRRYVDSARKYAEPQGNRNRWTLLQDRDIEHCFWRCGYEDVFRKAASPETITDTVWQRKAPAKKVIARAIERYSKPWLACLLLEAVLDRGSHRVPPPLRQAIETCVHMARHSG